MTKIANKKLKVGNVPNLRFPDFNGEWEFKNGNQIFDNISNKNHNSDLPILAITQEFGAIPRNLIDYKISVTDKSVEGYKVVEKGDFIISLRSFQGGIEYSEYKGICSPAYIILRSKAQIIDKFFKFYLKTPAYIISLNKNLEGIRDGKMISYKYFSEIHLPLPHIEEQNKISNFFNLIEARIQTQNKIIEGLKSRKIIVLKQIFDQTLKFKNDEGNSYPDWTRKTLGDISERVVSKNKEDNKNVLTISAQHGLISQLEYFNKSVSAKDVTGYYLLKRDDFAYNKSYSAGYPMGAIKRLIRYDKGVVSTLYICFRFNELVSKTFMEQYFEAGLQNIEIEKIAQEGARNHGLLNIGISDFFNISLILPSFSEQKKIADFLSVLDNSISNEITYLQKLEEQKKFFLRNLFV
ncbi:restriction endonuclease subunit S [Sphingobacterium sp. JUb20]|uniref:restriction endonuclease subunit S n=1 Tax=Sphingobacterium sp. JUb20 TaxID=2485110 RepID=UPI00104C1C8B|nr:restriction endonuclease subunit S [Sphingobacterium sp. JUb20]TCQ96831.1 type I restriction enzyme S subunit [Sphingobacterium sp. JUb20]